MLRSAPYVALAFIVFCFPATAGERFEQWLLESQGEGTFALAFKRPVPTQNGIGSGLAFVCNRENNYVVAILAPSLGTFTSQQETVPVAIQRAEDEFDSSDLLQTWENEGEYLFSEIPGEQQDLASYLKDRETESVKSVHFYFPNDLESNTPTNNHIAIDLSGFSAGFKAFKDRCEQAQ